MQNITLFNKKLYLRENSIRFGISKFEKITVNIISKLTSVNKNNVKRKRRKYKSTTKRSYSSIDP